MKEFYLKSLQDDVDEMMQLLSKSDHQESFYLHDNLKSRIDVKIEKRKLHFWLARNQYGFIFETSNGTLHSVDEETWNGLRRIFENYHLDKNYELNFTLGVIL